MLLGEMLVAAGFLNSVQLSECVEAGQISGKRLGEVVVERGLVTQEELYQILESQHKVPFVDLYRTSIPPEIIKHVPAELARRNRLAPVKIENNVLYIAIDDPKNFRAMNEVRQASRMEVRPMLASGRSIDAHIDKMYGNEAAQAALTEYSKGIDYAEQVSRIIETADTGVGSAPIVQLVNVLLEQAVSINASDIHVEPTPSEVRVRMRVDGVLSVAMNAPLSALNAIISRLKIMGDLNIAERRMPQDGRFNVRVLGREIDVRLSTVATVHGEKAVMRLLDRSNFFIPKERLGFTKENLEKFDSLMTTPHGIILVAGPTGSGKSTTLYTMLDEINDIRDNIVTIEDPVEYVLAGLNQMQVNPKAGVTFATGLRSILRQDPDVIMVGEIRDAETVEIAIRAAITGHLVLSTIHTNDAVSSILRLIDMGIPNYMVAASVVGVISQRLVRLICRECIDDYAPSPKELEMAHISPEEAEGINFKKGAGCPACDFIGFKGRMAVHEILVLNQNLRHMIHASENLEDIREYAQNAGMVPIRDSALELLKKGVTSISEMIDIVHGT
jgi:type IV pilus assembly protein PilB